MKTGALTTVGRGETPCIWTQAGVVAGKACRRAYDCTACSYDRALRRTARENRLLRSRGNLPAGRRGAIVSWKEKLRTLPPRQRPCVHHLKRRIGFRACRHDYLCGNCEFDQYFNDQHTVFAVVRPVNMLDVKGVRLPQGVYLHRGHCWVSVEEGNAVRVGLDDFALRLLAPFDRVEAPLLGKPLQQGAEAILALRGAHRARIQAPVSGVVTDVNPALREKGCPAGVDAYTEGWTLRAHVADLRNDLKALMIGEQATGFLDGEVERLHELIEETAGPLAVDGGTLGTDIFGHLPDLGWERLTAAFLGT
jgi:glycine cleavage system H lipoate-binding protein